MMRAKDDKKQILLLVFLSVGINLVLFFLDFAFYNPVFATNDDYRMSLIVCGAYTGTPSDTLVFMKYPLALLLSSLYQITTKVPWYGIGTMLCIFIPSCIICFYLLRETCRKNYILLGIFSYLLFYAFALQKHVVLPQFTLTAAFTGIGSLILLWFLPGKKYALQLIGAVILATISFSIRMKVFFMVAPVIILMSVFRLLSNDHRQIGDIKKYGIAAVLIVLLCSTVYAVDTANALPEDYRSFNTARSLVYDFGAMPAYNANKEFFDQIGVDETLYYGISARYLDIDDAITVETMRAITSYSGDGSGKTSHIPKIINTLSDCFTQFIDSNVIYPTLFAVVLVASTATLTFIIKRQHILVIVLGTVAFAFFEMSYLCYISRVMDRLTEVLLLIISTVSLIALLDSLWEKGSLPSRKITIRSGTLYKFLFKVGLTVSILVVSLCLLVANQNKVAARSENQNTINARLEVLNAYASSYTESFYFYDAYDFIAASADVFAVYDNAINTESLGNWYVNSPDYFNRNEQYGFTTSIEGLIDGNNNVYYAAIGNLKNGIVITLKERYNMEAVVIEVIPYINNNIYIYLFTPC